MTQVTLRRLASFMTLTLVLTHEAAAGPAAVTPASAATATLEERIARGGAAGDWTGIVALYASDPRAVRHEVDVTTRATVVDAMRQLGLTYSARKLLGPAGAADAPALRIARAALALAHGDANGASAQAAGIDDEDVDPALIPTLRTLRVRLALAAGDLDAAAARIGDRAAPALRAAVATAALDAGRTASDARVCPKAVVAYRWALDADGGRTARVAAAAGLVRAARACEDTAAMAVGLRVLADAPHSLLRRAAAVIGGTPTNAEHQAAATRRGG